MSRIAADRSMRVGLTLLAVLLAVGLSQAQDNVCDLGESPDVIVGNLDGIIVWGSANGLTAASVGTDSCNIGTCWLEWFSDINRHPVIAQNMFRLKNGRFEQIGQSWLKHGFGAFQEQLCSIDCIGAADFDHLGVNCSDLYSAGMNGSQGGLGPKSEVNATTGAYPYPPSGIGQGGDVVFRRLQMRTSDLTPSLNPGATYFVEGQYVTPDDAEAGNQNNNASYRRVVVSEVAGEIEMTYFLPTLREKAAIEGWVADDPAVLLTTVDIPGDGRFIIGSRATSIGSGYTHYEYAVHNLNSHRSMKSFRVRVPVDAHVTAPGFHDVDYHSGEPYDGTDWSASVEDLPDGRYIVWTTDDFAVNPDANALRWGTLYNFRFDANIPSRPTSAFLDLFRPGTPSEATGQVQTPRLCDNDGVCEPGEDCVFCQSDCLDQGSGGGCCGDGTCDPGETACSCEADCGPCLVPCGTPSECDDGIFCNGTEDCVGGFCERGGDPCPEEFCDESVDSCLTCLIDAHCDDEDPCNGAETCSGNICVPGTPLCTDDGVFCNGPETCTAGSCVSGPGPCPGLLCDETTDSCFVCNIDAHCDDSAFCTGVESCSNDTCFPGVDPCPGVPCDESFDVCIECSIDQDCADGLFCNGIEICAAPGICQPSAEPACPGALCDETGDFCFCSIDSHCDDGLFCNGGETCNGSTCEPGPDPCFGSPCNDDLDVCLECITAGECDDGLFCNGAEVCVAPGICDPAATPACAAACDESGDACLGTVASQPAAGEPLHGLTSTEAARFAEGATIFGLVHDSSMGLGPIYNGASCSSCHAQPAGGHGTAPITHFGDDTGGSFDPLEALGGSLHQSVALTPACDETVPPQANVTAQRIASSTLGAGLVEALDDATLEALALTPPSGLSGRAHSVEALEAPGVSRVGRFGGKAGSPTVLSYSAEEARNQLGLTNRLLPTENAPNGDTGLLATCDAVTDPEDGPDGEGLDFIDRVTDFQRYLAPPPQTPQTGMTGELWFTLSGCNGCHAPIFTTPDDPSLEAALRNRTLKPYSDFLLHEMGASADQIAQGDAAQTEMRTAPLWGLRERTALWHDGRISGGTFEDRVLAAIALHDVAGSEAQFSAQSFLSQSQVSRDATILFLDSLGHREFDHDGDGDVDRDDFVVFNSCFTGPGFFYSPNDPCAVSDVDRDGDVDDDDRSLFNFVAEGDAGEVPADSLTVNRDPGGITLTLQWAPSCQALDTQYAVYEGSLGDFTSHTALTCETGGATSRTLTPSAGNRYYFVVPNNGFHEGLYGRDSGDNPRPQAVPACMYQAGGSCP